jgi:hypothetical protein
MVSLQAVRDNRRLAGRFTGRLQDSLAGWDYVGRSHKNPTRRRLTGLVPELSTGVVRYLPRPALTAAAPQGPKRSAVCSAFSDSVAVLRAIGESCKESRDPPLRLEAHFSLLGSTGASSQAGVV